MKLLFVTVEPPWPLTGGASIRAYHFMRLQAQRHEVHLACYASVRQELEMREEFASLGCTVHTVPPPAARSSWQRLLGFVTSSLPDLAQRYADLSFGQMVVHLLSSQEFDLVHVVGLEAACAMHPWEEYGSLQLGRAQPASAERSVAPLIRPGIVLDELNAEYRMQERVFQVERSSPARWPGALYSLVQSSRLRRYEERLCCRVRGVIAVSEADNAALKRLCPSLRSEVIPNGVDTQRYQPLDHLVSSQRILPHLSEDTPVMLFVGTMDYRPNADAVAWFVQQVLPLIVQEMPRVHLLIVGRKPPAAVRQLASQHVTVTGAVYDDLPYFQRANVFVLPMRYGGGTRLKLLQALACGLPIVSTATGVEGVAVRQGEQAVIADRPDEFAQQVLRLLNDRQHAHELGVSARALALQYDWEKMAPRLEAFNQELVASPLPV